MLGNRVNSCLLARILHSSEERVLLTTFELSLPFNNFLRNPLLNILSHKTQLLRRFACYDKNLLLKER